MSILTILIASRVPLTGIRKCEHSCCFSAPPWRKLLFPFSPSSTVRSSPQLPRLLTSLLLYFEPRLPKMDLVLSPACAPGSPILFTSHNIILPNDLFETTHHCHIEEIGFLNCNIEDHHIIILDVTGRKPGIISCLVVLEKGFHYLFFHPCCILWLGLPHFYYHLLDILQYGFHLL